MTWLIIGKFLRTVFGNRYVQLVLVALALGGGGYALGRYAQPAKVITTEKVVTVVQEKVVYQDRVVIKEVKVKDKDKEKEKHTTTTTTKTPDGTVVTKTETSTKTKEKENEKTNTDTQKEKVVTVEKVVEKVVEKEKLVESKKLDWIVHAGAGVSIPTLLGAEQQGVPGLRGFVIDAGVDRRVVGPFYIGVQSNTEGVVGIRLSGAF